MRVDTTSYRDAAQKIIKWAVNGENRYACMANVHMVMEAYDDATFQNIVNQADLVVPDGMPMVWMLRRLGHLLEDRVYGPTLTLKLLEAASRQCIPVGFYGGAPDVLAQLLKNVQNAYKNIQIAYRYSPPFRELTPEEDKAIVQNIEASQTRILFVGLGCPKQEKWMAAHVDRMQAVMLGVGAAFDFHAGKVRHAPNWFQNKGLEWLYRLLIEPGRLWKRYLKHNPRFAVLGMMELARKRRCITIKLARRF